MKYLSSISNGKDIANKDYIDNKIPTKTSQLTNNSNFLVNSGTYLNIHPENSPVVIPFINNDIAFLTKRGGSTKVYYDGVEQSQDISNAFDGSGSYWAINPTGVSTIVIELSLHKVFTWTNTIYCDFGSSSWRSKYVKIEVINTNYSSDTWSAKYETSTNGSGNVKVTFGHTPVGASNAGGGFNKARFTFSNWNNATTFRISQLGVYNYGSIGTREPYMSRGIDDEIYRSITPAKNNTYNLGSSSKKWGNVYATSFSGDLTGTASKATGDKNGDDITTTYYKASNPNGYTSNTGTITGITMNGASKGTSGVVNLGTVITQHQDISGKANISDLATVATSGSYSDLSGKPDEGITVLTDSNIYIYNLDKGLYRMPGAHHAYYGASDVINSDYGAYLFITDSAITEDQHQWRQFIYLRKDRQCMGFARDDRGAVNDRFLTSADIEDSLTSTSSAKTLSANQGYVLDGKIANKQDTLVSGTNIKTINNTNLLGSGNLEVQNKLVSGTNIRTINGTNILGSGDLNLGVITTRDWSKQIEAAGNSMTTSSVEVPAITGYTCIASVLRTSSSGWMIYELAANGSIKIWNHNSSKFTVTLYGKFIYLKNT